MRPALPLLLALSVVACAPRHAPHGEDPDWRSEEGQERVRLQLIESLIDRGDTAEALIVIRTAHERGDDDPTLDLFQALALQETGLPAEAERLLRQYVSTRPRDARGWRALGVLLAEGRQVDEAIVALGRATELDGTDAATWNNLGFCLTAAGRHAEAVDALQQAVALDGTQARYRNNLGFALAADGRLAQALETFLSANGRADAHANMGLALERAGLRPDAATQYELALQYDPSHETSREALARLTPPTETIP